VNGSLLVLLDSKAILFIDTSCSFEKLDFLNSLFENCIIWTENPSTLSSLIKKNESLRARFFLRLERRDVIVVFVALRWVFHLFSF